MKYLLLLCVLMSSCTMRDPVQDEHVSLMLANIIITARAQREESAPPVIQTATAIETAAQAGLDALGYELDD